MSWGFRFSAKENTVTEDNLLWLESQQNKAADPSRLSVQATAQNQPGWGVTSDVLGGVGGFAGALFISLGLQAENTPAWNALYPNFRDRFLIDFGKSESMASSAVFSMATRIGTLNYNLNGPPRAKKFAQELLNKPGLADSLKTLTEKLSTDLDMADNGAFMELWKAGSPDKAPPKGAPCLGMAHLDSR